jgi:hypothetical protein
MPQAVSVTVTQETPPQGSSPGFFLLSLSTWPQGSKMPSNFTTSAVVAEQRLLRAVGHMILISGGLVVVAVGLASPFAHAATGSYALMGTRPGEVDVVSTFALVGAVLGARVRRLRRWAMAAAAVLLAVASAHALTSWAKAPEIMAVAHGIDARAGLAPLVVLAGQALLATEVFISSME